VLCYKDAIYKGLYENATVLFKKSIILIYRDLNLVTLLLYCILCCSGQLLRPIISRDFGELSLWPVVWVSTANYKSETHTSHTTITRRNRVKWARGAGKPQRIQHSNRVSRSYLQNIRIIAFLTQTVAFPYKPLYNKSNLCFSTSSGHLLEQWCENNGRWGGKFCHSRQNIKELETSGGERERVKQARARYTNAKRNEKRFQTLRSAFSYSLETGSVTREGFPR